MADDLFVVAVGLACQPGWLTWAMGGAAAASVAATCWAVRS